MPYIVNHNCCCGGGGGDGDPIQSIALNEEGHLIVTYQSGTTVDSGELLTQAQMDHIDNGISDLDLGGGLSLDENGKLQVDIPAADMNTPGLVQLSDDFELNENGQMVLSAVSIQKLMVDDDDELIIGG